MMAVACAGSGLKTTPFRSRKIIMRHEGDALVAVDKCVIFRQPKCIGRGQIGEARLFVTPFVDWTLKRRSQHAFVA